MMGNAMPLPLDPDIVEPVPEPPPKKKGRRSKEELIAAGYYDNKPDRAPKDISLAKPRSLKKELGALVETINGALLALPWTVDDALNQDEAERLVDGLDRAQQGNKRIRTYLDRANNVGGIGALIFAVLSIALPRLMRHGIIPAPKLTDEQRAALELQYQQMMAQRNGVVPPVYANTGQ